MAKPDCVEVWDVTATGLVFRGDLRLWGTVAGLAVTNVSVRSEVDQWLTGRMLDHTSSSSSDLLMHSFTW